ncbi:hypothetical protein TorRG33x02_322870, partial [Trema orientale]
MFFITIRLPHCSFEITQHIFFVRILFRHTLSEVYRSISPVHFIISGPANLFLLSPVTSMYLKILFTFIRLIRVTINRASNPSIARLPFIISIIVFIVTFISPRFAPSILPTSSPFDLIIRA